MRNHLVRSASQWDAEMVMGHPRMRGRVLLSSWLSLTDKGLRGEKKKDKEREREREKKENVRQSAIWKTVCDNCRYRAELAECFQQGA